VHVEAAIQYDGSHKSQPCLHEKGATQYDGGRNSQHVMSKDDDSKILFITDNWESAIPDPSEASALPETLTAAIDWVASTAPATIMAEREAIVNRIIDRAHELHTSGAVKQWYAAADADIRQACAEVNGPLMEELVHQSGFRDDECPDSFRHGARFIGPLKCPATMAPVQHRPPASIQALQRDLPEQNRSTLRKLKPDIFSDALIEQIEADAKLHRMTSPRPISESDMHQFAFAKRFGVEQGDKVVIDDLGNKTVTPKIRAIDDCTASGVNACTQPACKLRVDGIDS